MSVSRLFRWSGWNWLRAGNIVGNVVVGGNSGLIYQIYGSGPVPSPPFLSWHDLPPAGSPNEIFNLLSWKCRLAPELIGRDNDLAELVGWARSGPRLRIRFLVGVGGSGKTRLAAEVADILRRDGWHAGFSALEQEARLPISDRGLLVLLDYPEAWRENVQRLLREAARTERVPAPVRILLLSRRPLDEWKEDIFQSGASQLCDAVDVHLSVLGPTEALALFRRVVVRLAQHRRRAVPQLGDSAFTNWLADQSGTYALPLLVTAAAIHFVDTPGNTFILRGPEIITALVDRERTQLDRLGQNAHSGRRAASRLVGLAALRDGLDAPAIRRLASPRLETGLPEAANAVDAAKRMPGWDHNRLSAPAPDIVAAELLRQVTIDGEDRASEWFWAALSDPGALKLELIGRRIHDLITLHGPTESLLQETFCHALRNDPTRAKAWRAFLDDDTGGFRLSSVGIAVGRALLSQSDVADEERAGLNYSLSNRLRGAGDRPGALAAIREAVDGFRRLTQENPRHFAHYLAASLGSLSGALRNVGDGPGALAAIREAVDITRRLAQENPALFALDFAESVNNLSVALSDAGDGPGALAAIREAVDVFRRLAQENPAPFAPRLATCLNNLAVLLGNAEGGPGALAAIREAVDITRRLAQENPALFVPDLAERLNNFSVALGKVGDSPGALAAIREAVDIRGLLAQENPSRFEPDLATSLNNLGYQLSDAGDHPGALEAIGEAVVVFRRLARESPTRFAPELATSLSNLSTALSEVGDGPGALAAIREAVDIQRPFAQESPGRFEPDLATSLSNLAYRLSDAGDSLGAMAAMRETVDVFRRLAQGDPARFTPDLATSLTSLSVGLDNSGDGPGALAAIREAAGIMRRLAQEHPPRFAADLAMSLHNLSFYAGEGTDALQAIREAVDIWRRLVLDNPATFQPMLEKSLQLLERLQETNQKTLDR